MTPEKAKRIDNLAQNHCDMIKWVMAAMHHNHIHEQIIYSVLRDIVVRMGATDEQFFGCLNARFNYFQDKLLLEAEIDHPRMAADLDTRKIDEIPDSTELPPLFMS